MGNGTKIGLVLVLVLVVVVILNVFDGAEPNNLADPSEKSSSGGKDSSSASEKKRDPQLSSRTNAGTDRRSTTNGAAPKSTTPKSSSTPRNGSSSYEAGRDRRLAGRSGDRTTGTPSESSGRPAGSVLNRPNSGTTPSGSATNSGSSNTGSSNTGSSSNTAPRNRVTLPNAGDTNGANPAVTGRPATSGNGSSTLGNGVPTGRESSRLNPSPTGVGNSARPAPSGTEPAAGTDSTAGSIGNVRPSSSTGEGSAVPAIVGRKPGEGSSIPTVKPEKPTKLAGGDSSSGEWPKTHEVIQGDSLWHLAGRYYQKNTLFTHILENNPQLGDGSELRVGDRLKIPAPPRAVAKSPSDSKTRESASNLKPGFRTYTILDGDTLYDIAEDKLGSGLRWTEIKSANPGLDPARLKVGQKIQLPSS